MFPDERIFVFLGGFFFVFFGVDVALSIDIGVAMAVVAVALAVGISPSFRTDGKGLRMFSIFFRIFR